MVRTKEMAISIDPASVAPTLLTDKKMFLVGSVPTGLSFVLSCYRGEKMVSIQWQRFHVHAVSLTCLCGYTLMWHLMHSCPMLAQLFPLIHFRLHLGHLYSPKHLFLPWYGVSPSPFGRACAHNTQSCKQRTWNSSRRLQIMQIQRKKALSYHDTAKHYKQSSYTATLIAHVCVDIRWSRSNALENNVISIMCHFRIGRSRLYVAKMTTFDFYVNANAKLLN